MCEENRPFGRMWESLSSSTSRLDAGCFCLAVVDSEIVTVRVIAGQLEVPVMVGACIDVVNVGIKFARS